MTVAELPDLEAWQGPVAIEDLPEYIAQRNEDLEDEIFSQIREGLEEALEESRQQTEQWDKEDWEPLPHQKRPEGEWDVWGMMGGRGSGKTELGSREVLAHLREYKGKASVGVGAPTLSDVRKVCFEGPSGILAHAAPGEIVDYNRTMLTLTHRSGGVVMGHGSEKADRWRGYNWSLLWADELSSWNPDSWDQAQFGLRIDPAQAIFTTTPKNRPLIRELMADEATVITHATTYDNPHLAARALKALERRYGGTALGRQELMALLLDSAEKALWSRTMIEEFRLGKVDLSQLFRIVIGVDPAVTANELSDETGIVVVAKDFMGHGYVLADLSGRHTTDQWSQIVSTAYRGFGADLVVGEVNNGGDLVESALRTVDAHMSYKSVRASRGKAIRAEPVSSLYERGLIHHMAEDGLGDLEDQMCLWEPHEPDAMPNDRLDGLVWGLTELFVDEIAPPVVHALPTGRKKSRWR